MSTCPNKDILSAYTDGELASPWKETIELHLKKCSVCRDIYEHYDVLNRCIKAASAEPVFDTEASFTRLLAKRDIALAVKQAQKKTMGQDDRCALVLFFHTYSYSCRCRSCFCLCPYATGIFS